MKETISALTGKGIYGLKERSGRLVYCGTGKKTIVGMLIMEVLYSILINFQGERIIIQILQKI